MSTQLESDLKAALAGRAAELPDAAFDRVRRADYRPRRGLAPPPVQLAVVAGAATAGAFVASTLLGGAQPAFAGWTPSPTAPTPAQLSSAAASCQQQLTGLPVPPGLAQPTGWHADLTDVRGPYSFTVYTDQTGANEATCFTGPGFSFVRRDVTAGSGVAVSSTDGGPAGTGAGTVVSQGGAGATGDRIEHVNVAVLAQPDGGRYTLVEGRVQPEVTGVALVRGDGSTVQATTENGWFVAWWPKTEPVTAAEVTTSAGTTREALPLPTAGAPARCIESGAPGPVPCRVAPPGS
jgi:hypothetical protein